MMAAFCGNDWEFCETVCLAFTASSSLLDSPELEVACLLPCMVMAAFWGDDRAFFETVSLTFTASSSLLDSPELEVACLLPCMEITAFWGDDWAFLETCLTFSASSSLLDSPELEVACFLPCLVMAAFSGDDRAFFESGWLTGTASSSLLESSELEVACITMSALWGDDWEFCETGCLAFTASSSLLVSSELEVACLLPCMEITSFLGDDWGFFETCCLTFAASSSLLDSSELEVACFLPCFVMTFFETGSLTCTASSSLLDSPELEVTCFLPCLVMAAFWGDDCVTGTASSSLLESAELEVACFMMAAFWVDDLLNSSELEQSWYLSFLLSSVFCGDALLLLNSSMLETSLLMLAAFFLWSWLFCSIQMSSSCSQMNFKALEVDFFSSGSIGFSLHCWLTSSIDPSSPLDSSEVIRSWIWFVGFWGYSLGALDSSLSSSVDEWGSSAIAVSSLLAEEVLEKGCSWTMAVGSSQLWSFGTDFVWSTWLLSDFLLSDLVCWLEIFSTLSSDSIPAASEKELSLFVSCIVVRSSKPTLPLPADSFGASFTGDIVPGAASSTKSEPEMFCAITEALFIEASSLPPWLLDKSFVTLAVSRSGTNCINIFALANGPTNCDIILTNILRTMQT